MDTKTDLNKYTVIYTHRFMSGSHHHAIVKMARIIGPNLQAACDEAEIDIDSIDVTFEGYCVEVG